MSSSVLVNDTVRIKVKFVDVDPVTGEQESVSPSSVLVNIEKADGQDVVTNAFATAINSSEYYYDFTPSTAGQYTVTFNGIMPDTTQIVVNQNLYVSDADSDYRPTVTLKSDETIIFAPDIDPLYIDPEELLSFFPDASLLEIGELIHHYSLEMKEIFNLQDTETGSGISFTAAEYIKASACCELSRTYGFGGDDELSLKLADLSITNRSNPRNSINRGNATTWCQIAAALRKELMASRVGMRAVIPKGLPNKKIHSTYKTLDPDTGKLVYLSDKELYGPGRTTPTDPDDPMPDRKLKKYD
jgi:hypothetical protein